MVIIVISMSLYFVVNEYNRYDKSMINFIKNNETNIDLRNYIKGKNDLTGISTTLILVIEGYTDWNNLCLSDNFRKKYKTWKDLIDVKDIYEHISPGGANIENENEVMLFADVKSPIFENGNYEHLCYEYYYKYKLNDNNELDDVKLIRKLRTDATTGTILDKCEYD